jgi:hypothetical protein
MYSITFVGCILWQFKSHGKSYGGLGQIVAVIAIEMTATVHLSLHRRKCTDVVAVTTVGIAVMSVSLCLHGYRVSFTKSS